MIPEMNVLGINNGVLAGVEQVSSENWDLRPSGEISLIVIHCISLPEGNFGGRYIRDLFCNQLDCSQHPDFKSLEGVHVSSHLLIRRDGDCEQYVSLEDRAWHAGESSYRGRPTCNDYSIGIELEGSTAVPYTDLQYERLAEISGLIMSTYDIDDIVGHADIAPDRKTDPGDSFDWLRFRSLINNKYAAGLPDNTVK
ncbi:MAG: 1,6-anhydro-N-acetylmuramyl-L-alanine amidase AmpD [Pseudomonadales bacterium]|nr:1,6-anhydro-N-acetylmuramyl-L-alanine amidase AmpD [Pseudomonadales bacterium]